MSTALYPTSSSPAVVLGIEADRFQFVEPSRERLPADNASLRIAPRVLCDRSILCAELSKEIRSIETAGRMKDALSHPLRISTGCSELDRVLPHGGYAPGTLIEWIDGHKRSFRTSSAWYLAMIAARNAMQRDDKYLIVLDCQEAFYPPAARAMGVPLERLVVLRPSNSVDAMWSVEQALRCSAVGAVVAEIDSFSELNARRFQLAAEQGGAIGCFLRPARARTSPTWADIQWLVSPKPDSSSVSNSFDGRASQSLRSDHREFDLQLLRVRGGSSGSRWNLSIDSISGLLSAKPARFLDRKPVQVTSPVFASSVSASTRTFAREYLPHATATSTLHLASELAQPTNYRPSQIEKEIANQSTTYSDAAFAREAIQCRAG